jgi:hypothetical protein
LLELQQTFLNIVKKFDILRSTYTWEERIVKTLWNIQRLYNEIFPNSIKIVDDWLINFYRRIRLLHLFQSKDNLYQLVNLYKRYLKDFKNNVYTQEYYEVILNKFYTYYTEYDKWQKYNFFSTILNDLEKIFWNDNEKIITMRKFLLSKNQHIWNNKKTRSTRAKSRV